MIGTSIEDGIATVRIDDGRLNVIDLAAIRELAAAVEAQRDARAIVLVGAQRAFSAGVDLAGLLSAPLAYTEEFLEALESFVVALYRVEVPTVAAVTGHAIAGGCLLVAACDVRVMGTGRIGVTESLVGFPIPPAALEVLRARTGVRTESLVRTGTTLEPAEALAAGLVDEVVEPGRVVDRAHEVARTLAASPPASYAVQKRMLRADTDRRIEDTRAAFGDAVRETWLSDAPRAHAAAYLASLTRR